MIKRIFLLLMAAVMVFSLAACKGEEKTDDSPAGRASRNSASRRGKNEEQDAQDEQDVQDASTEASDADDPPLGDFNISDSMENTYWRTTGFDGIENETGDYWSDLFLWENGTGYFRFSQATPDSYFYGMHDVTSCGWSVTDDGSLTLFQPGTQLTLFTGAFSDGILTLNYDGYANEAIKLEQSEMPPYGSQWTILDLYGTWEMTSFTDAASGYHAAPYYAVDGEDIYFASEITLDRISGVHFWIADPLGSGLEAQRYLDIGQYDNYTWKPYTAGTIWEGCLNEAWYAELTGNNDSNVSLYVTYADGKLLLKKEDKSDLRRFPSTFTAEFEYVGYTTDLSEGDAVDIVDQRYGTFAYANIIFSYFYALQYNDDPDEIADYALALLVDNTDISDEGLLGELYTSIAEPVRYGVDIEFGYAIRDINEDDIPELFILTRHEPTGIEEIIAIYTIRAGRTVPVGAFWSRNRCMIDSEGFIYNTGSSGADDSFSVIYTLRPGTGELQLVEESGEYYDYSDYPPEDAGLIFAPLSQINVNTA